MTPVRIPGLPGGSAMFDVTAEAYWAFAEPPGEVAAPVGSLARMRQVGSAFARTLDAAERGCLIIGTGGSSRREDVLRMRHAAGIVGMWSEKDHTGEMAIEAGVPFIFGTVRALWEEGLGSEAQAEFHRRAALMHGKTVRMWRVGSKAFVQAFDDPVRCPCGEVREAVPWRGIMHDVPSCGKVFE